MLRTRAIRKCFSIDHAKITQIRTLATQAAATTSKSETTRKKEGDISSVFASLSGGEAVPLPDRFADIKTALIRNNETALEASWSRLLTALRTEVEVIATAGSSIIPEINFDQLDDKSRTKSFGDALEKRGAAIVRGVVAPDVSLAWKEEIKEYVKANPHTKGFPVDNPAVYELYWSPGQVKARAHPNMAQVQRFLMSFWKSDDPSALIDTQHPVAYADRVRIRQPGDSSFALGPHIDGGSAERWEANGYGNVFQKIFQGNWEDFNAWESSSRLSVNSDLYNGAGACSMFRMYQGWLAMSNTSAFEGTLLVNPLFKLATAYTMLRPFFSPKNSIAEANGYLDVSNWELDPVQNSVVQGATLGMAQELTTTLHPHLDLSRTMIHVPAVHPGDYVAWHCDSIHAVDAVHAGKSDSSVMYIPACPLTEANARYLVRQREAFLDGTPGPDFPGGVGEMKHIGRMTREDIASMGVEAESAMGLLPYTGTDRLTGRINELLNLTK